MKPHDPRDGIHANLADYAHAVEVHNPSRLLVVAGSRRRSARARCLEVKLPPYPWNVLALRHD